MIDLFYDLALIGFISYSIFMLISRKVGSYTTPIVAKTIKSRQKKLQAELATTKISGYVFKAIALTL